MIYLTKSALKYAANICEELPRYRVGIYPLYRLEIGGLMKSIQEYANDIQRVVSTSDQGQIYFNNGSVIQFISPTEDNARGNAFCLVIADKDIDYDFYAWLRSAEKIDYYKWINMNGG